VAVHTGCPGVYGARGLDQRVEKRLSPAGYDADLDEIYGVAKAGGLRVQDHELSSRQEGARPADGILSAEYPSRRSLCGYADRTFHPTLIFARHGCLDHRSVTSEMPIAQQPSMVSAGDVHPAATVVVTLMATEGKALAGNFFAGVTVVTLVTVVCRYFLDRGHISTS